MDLRDRLLSPPPLLGLFIGVVVASIIGGVVYDGSQDSALGIHGALVIYFYASASDSIALQLIVHIIPGLLYVLDNNIGYSLACAGWATSLAVFMVLKPS